MDKMTTHYDDGASRATACCKDEPAPDAKAKPVLSKNRPDGDSWLTKVCCTEATMLHAGVNVNILTVHHDNDAWQAI